MARPVRIARSALAPNVPHADLYVTQRHALLIDDLLIPAKSLINGTTISLHAAEDHDELEFFHIKLETHDAIYAEGAPCETLIRVDETMSNFAEYVRQHGATEAPEQVLRGYGLSWPAEQVEDYGPKLGFAMAGSAKAGHDPRPAA